MTVNAFNRGISKDSIGSKIPTGKNQLKCLDVQRILVEEVL
jgi:hypothetical protein